MCLLRTKTLSPPNPLIEVNMEKVLGVLKEEFPQANIYMSDSYYYTTTKEELMRFLKSDDTNEYRYVSEITDCDNFSYRLMGQIHCVDWGALPFGILWTQTPQGGHAINVFVDDNYEVWICEPQNDKLYKCPSDWIPYVIMV